MPRVWVASRFGDADYICGQLLDLAFSSAALKYAELKRTALSKSSTLTRAIAILLTVWTHRHVFRRESMTFDQEKRLHVNQRVICRRKSDFFWIKSSAKRAFGGCLGSKRR